MRYVIVEKRISAGYYTYALILLDMKKKLVKDITYYGEMEFWGKANTYKPYHEALSELFDKHRLSLTEVKVVSCGGFFQERCSKAIEEIIGV